MCEHAPSPREHLHAPKKWNWLIPQDEAGNPIDPETARIFLKAFTSHFRGYISHDGKGMPTNVRIVTPEDPMLANSRVLEMDNHFHTKDRKIMAMSTFVTASYDSAYTRLLTRIDGTGTTSLSYVPAGTHGAGKIAEEDGSLTGDIDKNSFTYDELGRVATTTAGSGNTEELEYDALSRITSIENNLGTFDISYVGQTSRPEAITLPNGQKTEYDYFPATGDHRLKSITNLQTGTLPSSILSKFDYTYTPTGNISSWERQAGDGTTVETPSVYSFEYDATDQLTAATLRNQVTNAILKKHRYAYDPAGNRTNSQQGNMVSSYTSNPANQTTDIASGGNLTVEETLNEPAKVTINGIPAGGANEKFKADIPVTPGSNSFDITAEDYSPSANTITGNWNVNILGGITSSPTYDANGNTTNDGPRQYGWVLKTG